MSEVSYFLVEVVDSPIVSLVGLKDPAERAGNMGSRYTPLFSQIVDSSLWLEADHVVKVFITMLAKQDRDHVVRGTALAIARWSNKTEKEVLKALEVLSSPDTQRLEPQPFEGRRIERVDGGWLLLNGARYQELMQEYNKRVYDANRKREERAALPATRRVLKKARRLPGQVGRTRGDRVADELDANGQAAEAERLRHAQAVLNQPDGGA